MLLRAQTSSSFSSSSSESTDSHRTFWQYWIVGLCVLSLPVQSTSILGGGKDTLSQRLSACFRAVLCSWARGTVFYLSCSKVDCILKKERLQFGDIENAFRNPNKVTVYDRVLFYDSLPSSCSVCLCSLIHLSILFKITFKSGFSQVL